MKTSRIAQETAKIVDSTSRADPVAPKRTRAFTRSLKSFTASDNPLNDTRPYSFEQGVSVTPSASSKDLQNGFDIEDLSTPRPTLRKRKRDLDTPTTEVTSISTAASTKTSPRKAGINNENGARKNGKKAKRQPAKRIVGENGDVKFEPPANWEEVYAAVKEMRKSRLAPVDTMGCETLAEEHLSAKDRRFQTLIALMLSSQTKDTTNAIAMRRLQTELPPPGLTLSNILEVDPVKLNELIYVVGFHNNKTRYIKAAAQILRDEYSGDIPDTVEGLMELPGVGPKMAYLCMSAAWGRTEGIGVDVHVHRITNLWGWHKTKDPEETRLLLQTWLPRDRWHEINHLLVGFGQTICAPVGRKCGECTLSERGLCPSVVVEKHSSVMKKARKVTEMKGSGPNPHKKEDVVVFKQEEFLP